MKKFLKGSILAVLGLVIFALLVTGGNIAIFWSIFNWIQDGIHEITGLDTPLAKALAALVLAAIVMLPFLKVLLSFTPIPQKKKGLYRSLVFGGIAIFFFLSYFAARNTYFDPKTGQPVKYYSQLPNGEYRFYSEPGFDPLTGDSLKKVTGEVSMKNNGLWTKNSPFDPKTGEALKYYSQLPNGEFRFYSGPGFEPITGDSLKKVTKEVSLKSQGLLPSNDSPFDPKTGEALKYYSQWPNGEYKIYSHPGYDPVTGDALKKLTKEVSLKSKGLWPTDVPADKPPVRKRSDYESRNTEQTSNSKPIEYEEESLPKKTEYIPPVNNQPDAPAPSPAKLEGNVSFHNETSILFRIYDSSGRVVKIVPPRQTVNEKMKPGTYYDIGNNIRNSFTVVGGRNLNLNFLRNPGNPAPSYGPRIYRPPVVRRLPRY